MAIVTLPGGWVDLRPMTGHDEYAVTGADLPNALHLIDRLLVDQPGACCTAGAAVLLPTALRDRLLAAICAMTYGPAVAAQTVCAACHARYDLSFDLDALLASQPLPAAGLPATLCLDGQTFRLPTGADELALIGLPADVAGQTLLLRCRIGDAADLPGTASELRRDFELALERTAPILSLDLAATCPECGAAQTLAFDMQQYLLGRILAEQSSLAAEVHALALTYRWSLHELLGLTRGQRQHYLSLIEAASSRASLRTPGTSARRRTA